MSTPNPTGGGIGQAAGELLKEMQKAQADVQVEQKAKQGQPQNQAFAQAMQAQQQSAQSNQLQAQASKDASQKVQGARVQGSDAINEVKKDERSRDRLASASTTRVGSTEKAEESKLTGMLQNLLTGQDKMTKIMDIALSGRQFGPSELLAMQAGVYRFTQELDLTSKVVEKATSGIKQTLNTQV